MKKQTSRKPGAKTGVDSLAVGSAVHRTMLYAAASAAAAKIVHHPRWPRLAADAHALATDIICAEVEAMLDDLRTDAARLDWLIRNQSGGVVSLRGAAMDAWCNGADWRTAIDAAMSEPNTKVSQRATSADSLQTSQPGGA